MRVRLAFQKLGRSAFASHLDLVRLLPRMLRRAGLPLFYTEGFHPKPDMTFAPALSLGIASLAEYVDVKLLAGTDVTGLAERLAGVSVDGLRFTGAHTLGPNDAGLSKVIDEADWVAAFARGVLPSLPEVEARIAARREGALIVRRTIEGIGKDVDVGKYLVSITPGGGAELLARAGIVGDLVPLAFTTRITGQGTTKATEVIEALLGKDLPARIVRAGLYGLRDSGRHAPLEVDALRRMHAPNADTAPTTTTAEA